MEVKEETIGKLRQRLGREPTQDEINEARDALIRQRYADMAGTAVMLRDDGKEHEPPAEGIPAASAAFEDVKLSDFPFGGPASNECVNKEDDAPARASAIKVFDDTELFNRVAQYNECFDDEWVDGLDDVIRDEGVLVARHNWDSGRSRGRSGHSRCI